MPEKEKEGDCVKYALFTWYAWGFGNHWTCKATADTIKELTDMVEGSIGSTWKITSTETGKTVKYHIAPECFWRYGMTKPEIDYKGDLKE